MSKITNHDLHIILIELRKDTQYLIDKSQSLETWQIEHEKKDEQRFSSINRYAASIAVVASFIGWMSSYLWQKMTGKI